MTDRWLTIVGIGEDGVGGLSPNARAAIERAEIVFGGTRHLELAAPLITGESQPWPKPFDISMRGVVEQRGRKVCVLASGDPFCHGVGATLARVVSLDEMIVLPHATAFSQAAARLGWPLKDIATVSLHGIPVRTLRPHLHPGRRIVALTSGEDGPREISELLIELRMGRSALTVLEAMGGPQERVRSFRADRLDASDIHPLNVVAIEVVADADAPVLSAAPGLPDELFEHDGQITKSEVRALTVSALAPHAGELVWDVGAGSGSVAIEWLLANPAGSAIAIEQDAERTARIERNAAALGVRNLTVIEGKAPEAFAQLPLPDVIFVGGGATDPGVVRSVLDLLKPGGRIVINAVTLETETLLAQLHGELGGELIRIQISRAGPIGSMTGWRPFMPVTQWRFRKPFDG